MSDGWVKAHAEMIRSREFVNLSDSAWRLYGSATIYAGTEATDGLLTSRDLAALPSYKRSARDELARAGLLTFMNKGIWYLSRYTEQQRSKAQIEQQQEAGRKRAEAFRASQKRKATDRWTP